MRTVGFVTIGQSPRPDLIDEFDRALANVRLVQAGALDGLSDAEIAQFAPREGDAVLVSRLRSGREVRLAHRRVAPRVQAALSRLAAEGADPLVLLCTGDFPDLVSRGVLVRPNRVFPHVVAAALEGVRVPGREARLGVAVPDAAQVPWAESRWRRLAPAVAVAVSPYGEPGRLDAAGRALAGADVSLVVMDCIGYTRAMQRTMARAAGVPAVFATGAVSMILRELFTRTAAPEWVGPTAKSNGCSTGERR
ncbi:MAG TPA: AroM family protein [bacterium]|nr:AroM family protein [bacterium]